MRRSAQKKFLGLKRTLITEPEEPVGDYEMVVLNNHHERWVMRLVWLLVGLVVLGIAMDIIFPPSSGLPPALTSLKSFVMPTRCLDADGEEGRSSRLARQLMCSFISSRRRPRKPNRQREHAEQHRRRQAEHAHHHADPRPTANVALDDGGLRAASSEAGRELLPVAGDRRHREGRGAVERGRGVGHQRDDGDESKDAREKAQDGHARHRSLLVCGLP